LTSLACPVRAAASEDVELALEDDALDDVGVPPRLPWGGIWA
jgi:hypothetical protein